MVDQASLEAMIKNIRASQASIKASWEVRLDAINKDIRAGQAMLMAKWDAINKETKASQANVEARLLSKVEGFEGWEIMECGDENNQN